MLAAEWHCFQTGRPAVKPDLRELASSLEQTAASPALLCARCSFHITDGDARLDGDGTHEHVRTNPFGITYHFGCFATAPGCRPSGAPSKQATWFADHWWYVQICGGCGEHLGWLFFSDAPDAREFFGLILDKLVAAERLTS